MTEETASSVVGSDTNAESYEAKWGLNLEGIYEIAVDQYKKGKEDVKLNYEERLNAVAYWRQATRGKWDESKTQDVGYFDVIGNDRKKAWQALGDMGQEEAKRKFVELLLSRHPAFSQLLDEMKRERDEKERQERERREAAAREEERLKQLREEEERRRREEEQRRRALETERVRQQQEALLSQQQQQQQQQQTVSVVDTKLQSETPALQPSDETDGSGVEDLSKYAVNQLSAAEFISEMKKDPDSCIIVGRGECVTVRVPTRADGSALYWEFATENYDIGFGLSFEWAYQPTASSPENGVDVSPKAASPNAATRVDPLLPVLRRNSHEQVIAGRHKFPGAGVYLLQFDNSFSMVRSKTLYYRVYYTK